MILLAAALAACGGAPRAAPASNQADPPAVERVTGQLGAHRFTLELGDATLERSESAIWSWKLGAGEVAVEDLGRADADSHFLVERSPRTVVRADGGWTLVTEVVVVVGGRVFRCMHEQKVADPDAPEAHRAVDRGVAVCNSLRVEP